MIEWLYRTSVEITLLIGLVLLLKGLVRRYLGAQIAFLLWLIPLARCFMWQKPEVEIALIEYQAFSSDQISITIFPNPNVAALSPDLYLIWVWLVGLSIWTGYRLFSIYALKIHLNQNRQPTLTEEIINIYKPLALKAHNIYKTQIPSAPFVTGLFKPTVYLPDDFHSRYNKIQQRCILAHELSHIERKDLWIQLIYEIVRAVFWFNPLIHIVGPIIREDQELACDHRTLKNSSNDERLEYGRALTERLHVNILPATMAFLLNQKERFIMLEKHHSSTVKTTAGALLVLTVGFIALTQTPHVVADDSSWPKETMQLNFEDIPLSEMTRMIFNFAQQDVVGIEQLSNQKVTLRIDSVKPYHAANTLLKCYGFKMEQRNNYYAIIQDYPDKNNYDSPKDCIKAKLD
ncbi:M56 family metallopeptidase [Microbulbifer sp. SSSA002]|uniref:M56 family metallopeptidase n=1 Tax=unclassified Microbulbifer TaxID=2619833 RepID=UPI00403A732F